MARENFKKMAGNVDWKVDVKPENILLTRDGVIKLGFARVINELQ